MARLVGPMLVRTLPKPSRVSHRLVASLFALRQGSMQELCSPTALSGHGVQTPMGSVGTVIGPRLPPLGSYYSIALLADGTVRTWGANDQNQLGIAGSDTNSPIIPAALAGVGSVLTVKASHHSSLVVLADLSVFSWGQNNKGQFGSGDTVTPAAGTGVAATGVSGITHISTGQDRVLALGGTDTPDRLLNWGGVGSGGADILTCAAP